APISAAVPSTGGEAMAGIDVELVPVRTKKKRRREARPQGAGMSRRDFLLLGIGAGGVLGAVGIGFLVAQIRDRVRAPDQPEDGDGGEGEAKDPDKKETAKEPDKKEADKKGMDEKGMDKKGMDEKGMNKKGVEGQ